MSDVTHKCGHPDCDTQIGLGLFACRPHWFNLPRSLRYPITSAWSRLQAAITIAGLNRAEAAHHAAVADAVNWWRSHP